VQCCFILVCNWKQR